MEDDQRLEPDAAEKAAFARDLNEARIRQHLSIRAAARLAGVPPATAQGWFSGKHYPTPALRPQYERLVRSLGLNPHRPDEPAPMAAALATLRENEPPYVGLRPYAVADVDIFFGRGTEARRIARLVHQQGTGLMVVLGPSGAGKSSLLAAGLLGRECGPEGILHGWTSALVNPGSVFTAPPDADLVVVDQFEDALAGPDRDAIVAAVADLARTAVVVLAVRSSAFAALSEYPALVPALERPVLVTPMSEREIREVIVAPAAARGVHVESGLVERLLRELSPAPGSPLPVGALPLLSNALLTTWGVGRGDRMTLADYQATGGLASAIEELAEDVLGRLDPASQERARTLFLRLVSHHDGVLELAAVPLASLDDDDARIASHFVSARILRVSDEHVRISHAALLSHWSRLGAWVEEGREDLALRDHLRRVTQIWIDNGRDPDSLLPVDRLPAFAILAEDPELEESLDAESREFLQASRAHFTTLLDAERRTSAKLRRGRSLARSLSAVALVLALIAGLSGWHAIGVQHEAQSRQVASQAGGFRAPNPNVQAQLALVADRLAHTPESRSALLEATALDAPVRWTGVGEAYLAVSPDGTTVVRVDGQGRITVWPGDEVHTSPGTTVVADPAGGSLFAAALAPGDGGTLLAIGGSAGFRQLWDVAGEPRLVADLGGGEATTYALAFDASGRRLLAGDSEGAVSWYDLDGGRADLVATGSCGFPVSGLAFAPSGGRVFVSGGPDHLSTLDLAGDALALGPDIPFDAREKVRANDVRISPDGQWLAAALSQSAVLRWRLEGDEAVWHDRLDSFGSWVNEVAFSADSRILLAGSSDQRVHVFDVASGTELRTLPGPSLFTSVGSVAGRIVAASTDGSLWVWSSESRQLRESGPAIFELSTDARGARWLAACVPGEQNVLLWDVAHGLTPRTPGVPPSGVRLTASSTVHPAGGRLYSGAREGQVVDWPLTDAGAGAPRAQRLAPEGSFAEVVFSADGRLLAGGQYTGRHSIIARVDADGTLTPIATLDTPWPQSLGFNPDATVLQVGVGTDAIHLYDVRTPEAPRRIAEISVPARSTSAFSPDGRRLVAASDNGTVSLWDVTVPAEPRRVRSLELPQAPVYAVSFSPDGKNLAVASGAEVVSVFDLNGHDSRPAYSLDARHGVATAATYLAGGSLLAGAAGGGVRVWLTDAEEARTLLCQRRGTPLSEQEWSRHLPGVAWVDPCR